MTKEQILAAIDAEADHIVKQYEHLTLPEGEPFATPPAQLLEDFITMTAYAAFKAQQVMREDGLSAADPAGAAAYLTELSFIAAIGRNLSSRQKPPELTFCMLANWLDRRKKDMVQSLQARGIPTVPQVALDQIADSSLRGTLVATDFALYGLMSMKAQPTSKGDLLNQYLEGLTVFGRQAATGN